MDWSTPVFPVLHHLPEFNQTHVHWISDVIQPSCLLSSPSPPAFHLSQKQGLFQRVCSSPHVAKILELHSVSVLPMNIQGWFHIGLTGFISLLSKSLLQHHSSKPLILRGSAFFIVQLSHPYMTTGKTIALTRWIFVDKVMPLLFNMLPRLVITFLPRSKRLLISWLQSPSAVILEPRKIKSATVPTVAPSICHKVMGPDAMILVFWMLSFKPTFSLPLSLSSGGFLVPLHFLP